MYSFFLYAWLNVLQSLVLLKSMFIIKHSSPLSRSQFHVKLGDHARAARMLIRVAENISKFPTRKLSGFLFLLNSLLSRHGSLQSTPLYWIMMVFFYLHSSFYPLELRIIECIPAGFSIDGNHCGKKSRLAFVENRLSVSKFYYFHRIVVLLSNCFFFCPAVILNSVLWFMGFFKAFAL